MKKLFISQPMRDKTEEEIINERNKAVANAYEVFGEDVEIIDSYFKDEPDVKNKQLFFLGKSLELLSEADAALFIGDWAKYRGCKIEHTCAEEYGIKIIEE